VAALLHDRGVADSGVTSVADSVTEHRLTAGAEPAVGQDVVRPDLSAIVLCYRAQEGITAVVDSLYDLLEHAGVSFELVLVANTWLGDDDRTPAVVEKFARSHPKARTVVRPKEGGMGWDMRTGFDAARGSILIAIDGDRQNPVEDVLRMYEELSKSGVLKGGEELAKGPGTATTVRSVSGQMKVFDGPFIESKEQVGGFAMIEATDLDAAIAIAKSWPGGDVEVRPIVVH